MYPEMRRKKQALSPAACDAILQAGTSGVLALSGADGQPYAVPLSYVYHEGKVYFHCARAGHKLDLLDQNPKASFCVIGQDQVVPEKYTTYYRSVILFGTVRRLPDGCQLEVNHVDAGQPGAFWYAEIEYPTVEAARAWAPSTPALAGYLACEVTGQPGQSMGAYWEKTR